MNNNVLNNLALLLQGLSLEILFRDYNNTDKAIPLLSALKYTTENKSLKLPTRKKDFRFIRGLYAIF